MWKCKECNGEIIAMVEIVNSFDFTLDKNRNIGLYKHHGTETFEQVLKENTTGICCDKCGNGRNTIDELEEIAVWEED